MWETIENYISVDSSGLATFPGTWDGTWRSSVSDLSKEKSLPKLSVIA